MAISIGKLYFSKQCSMLADLISFHATVTPTIDFKMLISLKIFDARFLSSTPEMKYLTNNLRYFKLKASIISTYRGCNLDVTFFEEILTYVRQVSQLTRAG